MSKQLTTLNYDDKVILVGDIVVAKATRNVKGWGWNSTIWMRTSTRKNFTTHIDALPAACKALRINPEKIIFTPEKA